MTRAQADVRDAVPGDALALQSIWLDFAEGRPADRQAARPAWSSRSSAPSSGSRPTRRSGSWSP